LKRALVVPPLLLLALLAALASCRAGTAAKDGKPSAEAEGIPDPAPPPAEAAGAPDPVQPPAEAAGAPDPVQPPAKAAGAPDPAPPPAKAAGAPAWETVQRLTFPPEGYVVEAALLPDLRFAWKTNLPFQTRFQIAGDAGFASPVVDEAAEGEAFRGCSLPEGTWRWRIQAQDPEGAVFVSPPRSFVVAPPLAAPRLLEPEPGGQALVPEGDPLVLSWTAAEGAEHYRLVLRHREDPDKTVYENSLIRGTSESLSLDDYPEGEYRWTVEGLAAENPRRTRRTGLPTEGAFSLRKLRPARLEYPGNDTEFEGLLAYREPGALGWSSPDPVGRSSLILSTQSDFAGPPLVLIEDPPQHIALPRLPAGTYYWTVRAETPDGLDISAREPRWFRVLPVPLLPAAENRLPEDGKAIGGEELRENRRIVFSWDAVTGAGGYLFSLENADTGATIMERGPMAETELALEDLSLLEVGTFAWQVEAVAADPEGDIIQEGEPGGNRFTIDFGLPGKPTVQSPGVLYGRE
jgi:hypothetical protein